MNTIANLKTHTGGDPKAVEEILSCYNLKPLSKQEIRKVFCVETDQGFKCLKKTKLGAHELMFIHQAKEYLARKGFPTTDRYLPTADRHPYVIYDGSIYTLTDWIKDSKEVNYKQIDQLMLSIYTLVKFQKASEGFIPINPPQDRVLWGKWPSRFEIRFNQLNKFYNLAQNKKRKTQFDQKFLNHYYYFYRQAEKFLSLLPHSPYLKISEEGIKRRSFCHHDFSCRNLLLAQQRQIFLIDFEYGLCDIRLHDLASLIIRNMKTSRWNLELAALILRYYHKLYPLSRDEFEVLWLFMIWPQDFWQVALQYYEEKQPWSKKKFLGSIIKKTKDIRPREEFLQRFPDLWPIH